MKPPKPLAVFRFGTILLVLAMIMACNFLGFNTVSPTITSSPIKTFIVVETTPAQPASPTWTSQPSLTDTLAPVMPISPTLPPSPTDTIPPTQIPSPTPSGNNPSTVFLKTSISVITAFINQCPDKDPNYELIRKNFAILKDGAAVGDVHCTEPFTAMPIADFTNELITLQAMRLAYYLDTGTLSYLPWTSESLFAWLTAKISGVNLVTAPGQTYCCDTIQNKAYIVQSIQSDEQREYKREWVSLFDTLAYYAHEARHLDGSYGHVTGCEAFPNPGDSPGCDASYDLANLGPYGIQYWLENALLSGYLDIGISCTPDTASNALQSLQNNLNLQYRRRFVTEIPPLVDLPPQPYGGPCYAE